MLLQQFLLLIDLISKNNTSWLNIEELESTQWSEYVDYRKLCKDKTGEDPLQCPQCKKIMSFSEIHFTKYKPHVDDS